MFSCCSCYSGSSYMTVSSSKPCHPSVAMLLHHGPDAPSLPYPFSNSGSKSNMLERSNCLGLGLLFFYFACSALGAVCVVKIEQCRGGGGFLVPLAEL